MRDGLLAVAYNNLNAALRKAGRHTEAEDFFQKSLHLKEKVAKSEYGNTPESKEQRANGFRNQGTTLCFKDDRQAVGSYIEALDLYSELAENDPNHYFMLLKTGIECVRAAIRSNQLNIVEGLLDTLEATGKVACERLGTKEVYALLAMLHEERGKLLLIKEDVLGAEAEYRKHIAIYSDIVSQTGTWAYKRDLSIGYRNLANALLIKGASEESFEVLEKSFILREAVFRETGQKQIGTEAMTLVHLLIKHPGCDSISQNIYGSQAKELEKRL